MSKGLGFYGQDFFVIKEDADLVSESIARIIMTNWNERVGMPQFGGDLKRLLFNQNDDESYTQMKQGLTEMLSVYEPRAIIKSLDVSFDEAKAKVTISIAFNYVGDPNADPRLMDLELNIVS